MEIRKGKVGPLGVGIQGDCLSIVTDLCGTSQTGIVIAVRGQKDIRIDFADTYRIGSLYCLEIRDFPYDTFSYHFLVDGELIQDPYAKLSLGCDRFGDAKNCDKKCEHVVTDMDFDWGIDRPLEIPYHDSIFYKLHMRGFTKHASSGVAHKGTFLGLQEKIPYLKELGITAVVSMPIFEFDDVIYNETYQKVNKELLPFLEEANKPWEYKTNYWGYTTGSYMAPKRAYASCDRPDVELKQLIKTLHQNGIEFIVEFFFPAQTRPGFILDVCRWWVSEYHMDGFKLKGSDLPVKLLTTDPYLAHTKLIFEHVDPSWILTNADAYQNVAVMSGGFLYDVRKFLKGDEDMLSSVSRHFKENPGWGGIVNEISTYQGFTLCDLVSYDRKHNEDNGEDNHDGSDYNYSWNCGAEGATRKKSIQLLRMKQCKNAMSMLLLSQGTPILLAGDEFLNSASGNNNPYCQDNAISWLNWKQNKQTKELFAYIKELIAFRKKHPILHTKDALRQMDYMALGYPDLSYHNEQAWYAGFENYNRHMGVMYCGKYVKIDRTHTDDFIYVAYNMHWIDHHFALPKLPSDLTWEIQLATANEENVHFVADPGEKPNGKRNKAVLSPRMIAVFTSVKKGGSNE